MGRAIPAAVGPPLARLFLGTRTVEETAQPRGRLQPHAQPGLLQQRQQPSPGFKRVARVFFVHLRRAVAIDVVEQVARLLGDWQGQHPAAFAAAPAFPARGRLALIKKKVEQSHIDNWLIRRDNGAVNGR